MIGKIHLADNLEVLRTLPSGSVDLIYIDPPFNTGKRMERRQVRAVRTADGEGDRVGFHGASYRLARG